MERPLCFWPDEFNCCTGTGEEDEGEQVRGKLLLLLAGKNLLLLSSWQHLLLLLLIAIVHGAGESDRVLSITLLGLLLME